MLSIQYKQPSADYLVVKESPLGLSILSRHKSYANADKVAKSAASAYVVHMSEYNTAPKISKILLLDY